jgi:streptomycin 6-kinase
VTGEPFEREAIDSFASKAEWDATAAELVSIMLDRWELRPGEPFDAGVAGATLAVTTPEGEPAVLKVGYPHWEAVFEAVGLAAYGHRLAPRILREDPWTWSLLLERVEPGDPVSILAPADALVAASRLHVELSRVSIPDGVPALAEVIASYLTPARALATEPEVAAALDELSRLSLEPAPTMLLHGDFNPGNVLLSANGLRVIDPKPFAGDPAFDLWPLLEQVGTPSAASLDLVARTTGYPRDRIVRWAYARAGLNVTWFLDDVDEPPDTERAALELERMRFWRSLSES